MPLKVGRNISGQIYTNIYIYCMGAKDCCNGRLEAATISEINFCIYWVREISGKIQGKVREF